MTDKTITPDEWLYVANEVYPEYEWINNGGDILCILFGSFEPSNYKSPIFDAQRLRIADYLAEKGANVVWNDIKEAFIAQPKYGRHIIASHKDINLCRALAVLALIEGRE